MKNTVRKTKYPGVKMLGDGRALVRYGVTNPKTGRLKRTEKVLSDVANPAEASARRLALIQEMREGAKLKPRVRLADYAESWLHGKVRVLKSSTAERYATTLDLHILPTLGDYYLDAIVQRDIVAWRDQQDAKPATVNARLRVLKTMLRDATYEHELPRDPSLRVSAVREVNLHQERPNSLTAEQLAVFLEGVRQYRPKYHPLVAVLAYTGARISEATSLRWEDIVPPMMDSSGRFRPGAIKIRRAHHRGEVDTTKTDVRRTVPLPKELWEILGEHWKTIGTWNFKSDQRENIIAKKTPRELQSLQNEAHERGWLFPNNPSRGGKHGPMFTSVLRKPFNEVLDLLEAQGDDVQRITVHGLRRTLNNLLRQEVDDKVVVRSMLGHATEKMTEHYSHVRHEEKVVALEQVVTVLRQKRAEAAPLARVSGGSSGDLVKSASVMRNLTELTLRNAEGISADLKNMGLDCLPSESRVKPLSGASRARKVAGSACERKNARLELSL
jgi:integrase